MVGHDGYKHEEEYGSTPQNLMTIQEDSRMPTSKKVAHHVNGTTPAPVRTESSAPPMEFSGMCAEPDGEEAPLRTEELG